MTTAGTTPIKTPFYDRHVEAGAKIVEFAGFFMPVQYQGITVEHLAVRDNVGLFDLSHMGEFEVTGSGALDFLQKMTTNNPAKLDIGQIQYTCMPYPEGGIVDDLLIYRTGEQVYLLVVNAANLQKDFDWLESHRDDQVKLVDRSSEFGLLAIQGPKAQELMQKLTDYDLESMPYYSHVTAEVAGVDLLFSRTGYTGEDGFELYIPPAHCDKLWQAVIDVGRSHELALIGLGARDTLRLEMKMTLYGNDINQDTTPIEAGLGWIIDFDTDFIGKDVILAQKQDKPKRRLVCFEVEGRSVPRHGYDIFDGDEKIGMVTSGTFSPSLQKSIALGYVPRLKGKIGETVEIGVRNRRLVATVVKPPFYKKASHR